MENLYIVCVLYNSSIKEIASLETFLYFVGKYDFVKLMVMDNSSDKYTAGNRAEWEELYRDSIIYVKNDGNIGLSKAYNRALEIIKDDVFRVMYSDDDTIFSKEYIQNVIDAAKENRTDIIAGIVHANKNIISPVKKLKFGSDQIRVSEAGIYNDIYCINTGLTIKNTVYDITGKYDERLFLDGVDHFFSDKLINHGINRIEIVDGDIKQNFSAETNDLKARKTRAKIYTHDWLTWWKLGHKHTFFIFTSVFLTNGSVVKRTLLKLIGKSV